MNEQLKQDKKNRGHVNKLLFSGDIKEIWGPNKWKNLFALVDISSIILFRILFGIIMLIEVFNYFDLIQRYWILPKYHFYYWPFDFISPLPGNGMYILFYLMGILSVFIIVGLFYRVSMTLFWLCFSYMFLLEQARYLNHFYLIILISFVMIFIPAHKTASLDSKLFKKIRSETCEAWSLWLLRFMIALPYFFGGVAKLNSDWLQGEPLRSWLTKNAHVSVFGSLFQYESIILLIVYSGLILDLLIIPALLFKKTRTWGFLIITFFHLVNADLFKIGIFPWFMIAATTLFFDPDWPRNFVNYFSKKKNRWPLLILSKEKLISPNELNRKQNIIKIGLSIWVCIHLFLPLRHLFIPGNVNWTDEGEKFAWHMKLKDKREIGTYVAKNKKTNEVYNINVYDYLKPWQKNKMEDKPTLILQFCKIVSDDYRKKGEDVAVYANIKVSLNGRKYQQFTDTTVDLSVASVESFSHYKWIIPLKTPLNDRLIENKSPSMINVTE